MSQKTILAKFEEDMGRLLSDFGYQPISVHSNFSEPFGICFTFKLGNNQETYFYFDQKTNNVILSELIFGQIVNLCSSFV